METTKVVLLPLDERPCNYNFPAQLFSTKELNIVQPKQLGDKKFPADVEQIKEFLLAECKDAKIAVLALDTLLYGGLIPSRLHHKTYDEVMAKLNLVRELKQINPELKIYAFQCIMRCPKYSSSDEEPDYYGDCGTEIHALGNVIHKQSLNLASESEKEDLLKQIPHDALADYMARREFNLKMNLEVLQLAKDKIFEFLVIPQDDSAPYGYTAMDQMTVRKHIKELRLQEQVVIYPGADEVELTLLSRAINELHQKVPKVYVKYASVKAPYMVPSYEDRCLGETVKCHLMAAGCRQIENADVADLILALSAPANEMLEANNQPANNANYDIERNLVEFVASIKAYIDNQIPVSIADNAYANGSDLELIGILDRNELLLKVAGYAGWNTSSNTMGTAIAQGVKYLYQGQDFVHRNFLLLRYLEDAGYCAYVRNDITVNHLPQRKMDYFDVKEQHGEISQLVKEKLLQFSNERLHSIYEHIQIEDVRMPWRRMFETEIKVSYK